jgi:hypothetical protein
MKLKSYIGTAMALIILCTAAHAYAATAPATISEPDEILKTALFSAQYEDYLPSEWFKTAKLNANLTRGDAAYLFINTLARASGNAPTSLQYKTNLKDSKDPMFSRAVDLGLMSVEQDLKFNPTKVVTRQEMAVMTTKLIIKLKAYQKPTKVLTFKDGSKIAPWAKESVQYLAQKQWLLWVKGDNFEPKKTVTLAQTIAISDQILSTFKVYPSAIKPVGTEKKFEVKGFKVPLPTSSELEISVNANEALHIVFSGNLKNRTQNTHKWVNQQLIELLDSNKSVSFDARSSLLDSLSKNWDKNLQNYHFENDLYIRLDNGQLSPTKPNVANIMIQKGNVLSLEIVQ